jgi:deazaflavin-dependent oxidoreductase (nitroreductase family)
MHPVTTFNRRLVRIGNRIGVWMYRAFDGRLASYSKGATVLMITIPGRRTGVLHSTCVRYLHTADGFLVWGTASGAPRDPDWFRNLREAKIADVQIRAKTLQVRPRELLGEERETAWKNVVLARAPEVQKYAQRAGRTIPVARLQPVEGRLGEARQLTTAEP